MDGCLAATETAALLRRIMVEEGRHAALTTTVVQSPAQAAALRFPGSPTVRVNGRDIEPARAAEPGGTLSCRLYHTPRGLSGVPPEALLRAALRALPAGECSA